MVKTVKMAKLYKLTNQDGMTRGNTQWGEGVTHTAEPGDGPLCSRYWIHAYEDPLQAVFFNPIHASINKPVLWTAEGEIGIKDATKCGCKSLTTIQKIALPDLTIIQRVAVAIFCARIVCKNVEWNKWADNWLSGKDRSEAAAWSEARSAARGAWAASAAARGAAEAWSAARAARAAARAEAEAAAWAARGRVDTINILHQVVIKF